MDDSNQRRKKDGERKMGKKKDYNSGEGLEPMFWVLIEKAAMLVTCM